MFFYKLIVLLIYAIPQTPISAALKCYSCGEENKFLGPEYPKPLSCDEMEKSHNLIEYVIECPNNYLGCITQLKGKEIMRTCDTLPIDDCKTANGIKYCYCSDDLCNYSIKMPRNDARKSSRDILINYPSDDEDYDDDDDDDDNDDTNDNNNNNSSGMGGLTSDEENDANDENDNDNHDFTEDTRHKEVEVVLNRNNSSRNNNNFQIFIIFILILNFRNL